MENFRIENKPLNMFIGVFWGIRKWAGSLRDLELYEIIITPVAVSFEIGKSRVVLFFSKVHIQSFPLGIIIMLKAPIFR